MGRKEIDTSPKNNETDIDVKKQKSYTYRSIGRFGNKYQDYKNRNRLFNYNNINTVENANKNDEVEVEDIRKSRSVTKIKKKHRHHRHHHYQHFKRPKRTINISKIDHFSIIQNNE